MGGTMKNIALVLLLSTFLVTVSAINYWEWRESDRHKAFEYKLLSIFFPRAMILHGWKYDNAKTAELLNTNFDATFWAGWFIAPQWKIAAAAYLQCPSFDEPWICYNLVLTWVAHGIAELLLFF